jgi:hypothetical protein
VRVPRLAVPCDIFAYCQETLLNEKPPSGNVDGTAGDTIIIAPPYNSGDSELEEIVTKLARAVDGPSSRA